MNTFVIQIPQEGSPILKGGIPILYEDNSYYMIVDGELYNQDILYQELSKIFIFENTLEHVVFYAWKAWGFKATSHFEGAYSFAIINDTTCCVVKDPLGLRPIFYCEYDNTITISNTIKTLLQESHIPAILSKQGLLDLFAFGPSLPEDRTLYDGIFALPMGSYLNINDYEITKEVYYTLPIYEHNDDFETTCAHVKELLTHSIKQQLNNCQANFLSGGLDSSIITAVCAREQETWKTYSLEYEGNAENFKGNQYQVSLDNAYIEEMVQRYACDHTICTITQEELADKLEQAMLARDHPGMADIDSSLLWLCEQVHTKEDIILSGECSDEIFGGYPWFYRDELTTLNTFPWLRSMKERISLLHDQIKDLDYEAYMQKIYDESIQQVTYLDSDTKEDRLARKQTYLCLHWFMQTLITRQVCEGDGANMNIRAPFANVRLLEYVYNIPWSMKFYKQQEKGILRKAFEEELPDDICWRKKNPFPKTHNPKYADLVAGLLQSCVDDPTSPLHILFNIDKLKELIETKGASYTLPWYGQLMSGPQLLAYLYQIDRWIRDYHIEIKL